MTSVDDSSVSRGGLVTRMRRGRREPFAIGLVPADPREVWALVSDVTKIEQWWPRALGGEVADADVADNDGAGDDGAGREQIVRLEWGRVEGIVRQKVVAWEPNRRYGWTIMSEATAERVLPPLADTTVTIRIEPEGAASRVRIDGRFDPVGMRGAMALRQLSRLARTAYKRALKNLESTFTSPR